jgi:hypothetical protein
MEWRNRIIGAGPNNFADLLAGFSFLQKRSSLQNWGLVFCFMQGKISYESRLQVLFYSGETTVRSESRCALWLRYVDLVVSIEVAVEACCCFTVFSC